MADGSAQTIRYYSAAQLVDLPGMPSTERGVRKQAEKDRWAKRPKAIGKGWEYAETSLPQIARKELNRRSAIAAANTAHVSSDFAAGQTISRRIALREKIDAAAAQRIRETGIARAAGLSGNARARMDAKLDLLAARRRVRKHHGLGMCAAREGFCAAIRSGEIVIADNVKWFGGSTYRRRASAVGNGRSPHRARPRSPATTATAKALVRSSRRAPLRDFALGLLTDKPHISAKNMHRSIRARFGSTALSIPTVRTTARFLARSKPKTRSCIPRSRTRTRGRTNTCPRSAARARTSRA
jgi:putative transposase